ncbi:hypothetical protein [Methylobacterium trifolii]|uniref:Uncharacterized protein n=1 Tax=Methylobacterium trifolii TaxID=1003092 RepID=A0ABQ4TZQ8_9HYPH|nr:hypothetical protein [Methylobacterium trifolii]GJE60228.1 hypothetical protein MPOCJGCO_2339 [Methylobacterium trifolii]
MAFHRTYIADLLGAMDKDLALGVQSELATLIGPCVSDLYEGNWVYFADATTKAGAHECLVYFMPPGRSIVLQSPKLPKGDFELGGDQGGNTNPNSGACEVYVKWKDAKTLARLAFHELLHNRLKLGNTLHKEDGLRTGGVITSATKLTDGNKRDMAKGIKQPVPQWSDGIILMTNGFHDPMSEFYKP